LERRVLSEDRFIDSIDASKIVMPNRGMLQKTIIINGRG